MTRIRSPTAMTPAERSARWREARRGEQARQITVTLTPANSIKAKTMIKMGLSTSLSAFINKLVEEY